ncbi:MAG: hypothetical protein H6765_06130 [Candidatus Peribacteria bacterium]|nr:MAG: hypothetical protein H6765_06130 [Candidatus Peribacteria bacterium]
MSPEKCQEYLLMIESKLTPVTQYLKLTQLFALETPTATLISTANLLLQQYLQLA